MRVQSVPAEHITSRILLLRGQKVMLDAHLAELYNVTTRALIQAVKRNLKRFPRDFMFLLTDQDLTILRSQIVISSSPLPNWGGPTLGEPCVYRTGRRYAFFGASQRPCDSSKYRHHASFRSPARNRFCQHGACKRTRRTRRQSVRARRSDWQNRARDTRARCTAGCRTIPQDRIRIGRQRRWIE